MRESVLERLVPLVQVLLASCWLCRRNEAIEDSDESMNMLNIDDTDDIDASKDYATLHCHAVISKLKNEVFIYVPLGSMLDLSGTAFLQVSEADVLSFKRCDLPSLCIKYFLRFFVCCHVLAPVLICILFATSSMANPQNSEFSIPISSIHPLAVVLLKCGFWHRRWRGLQAQVPRFLMTTTSFKDFEVDSRLFTRRIPSLLS